MIKHCQELAVDNTLDLADQPGSEQPTGWLMAQKLHAGAAPRCRERDARTLSEDDKILATVAATVSAVVCTYCTSI